MRSAAVVALFGMPTLPFGLSVLAPPDMQSFERAFGGKSANKTNICEQIALPQDYADMLGWPPLTQTVARVWRTLPAADTAKHNHSRHELWTRWCNGSTRWLARIAADNFPRGVVLVFRGRWPNGFDGGGHWCEPCRIAPVVRMKSRKLRERTIRGAWPKNNQCRLCLSRTDQVAGCRIAFVCWTELTVNQRRAPA